MAPNAAGYYRIRRQAADVDSDVYGELALFAVDFTRYSTRAYLAHCPLLAAASSLAVDALRLAPLPTRPSVPYTECLRHPMDGSL